MQNEIHYKYTHSIILYDNCWLKNEACGFPYYQQ